MNVSSGRRGGPRSSSLFILLGVFAVSIAALVGAVLYVVSSSSDATVAGDLRDRGELGGFDGERDGDPFVATTDEIVVATNPVTTPAPTTTMSAATTTTSTTVAETIPPPTTVPGDLAMAGLDMLRPECDGRYITVVASAVTPGRYVENVGSALATYSGSDYLRTDQTCPSLRANFDGDPIYVTYFGPFADVGEACLNRSRGPADAYVRQLSDFTSPDHVINCS